MRKEGKRTEADVNLGGSGHLEGVWIASLMVSASKCKMVKLPVIHNWVFDASPLKACVF
jgi:hypothetical protein